MEQRAVGRCGGAGNDGRKLCQCSILRGIQFLAGLIPGLKFFIVACCLLYVLHVLHCAAPPAQKNKFKINCFNSGINIIFKER